MQPEISVLGLSVKTFGLCFAAAFVASGLLTWRRLKEIGRPPDDAYGLIFAALIGGLVGARVHYALEHLSAVRSDPLGSIFSGTGLVFYGGALGGAIGVLIWAHRHRFVNLALFDLAAAPLAIGYAVGRIGCQVSGDGDYGKVSSLPWAMGYPHGTVPTAPGVTVQPTPIYETLTMGLVTWVLWRMRDRVRPGLVFATWLVLAGLERFLVEFVRRNPEVWAGLTQPQLESLGLIAIGALWIGLAARRGSLLVPRRPVVAV
jgi:phosphatidylglycerol:prolipoprotein diacylglycerol transferase